MTNLRLFLLVRICLSSFISVFLSFNMIFGQPSSINDQKSSFFPFSPFNLKIQILSDTLDLVPIIRESTVNQSDSTRLSSIINAGVDKQINALPYPKQILRKSLIVPGLGQYHNDQSWKIPIIYGLLGGLSYYSVYLTKQYHDYKAAYYNAVTDHDDLRFGPTPERLIGANTNQLKNNRNFLRNRRDLIYVTVGLAYALSAIDAYVYAHLSTFDVSDDLSLRPTFDIYQLQSSKSGTENTTTSKAVPMLGFQLDFK